MSAQIGVWNLGERPLDPVVLEKLSVAIEPYGPDDSGSHISGPIGIAYRALQTTPESRLESQPHISSHGLIVTWDGRLDNREDLVSQLRGDVTSSSTDVGIVTRAFERWGENCFRKLIGDWALSVWDPSAQTLVLAVDYACMRRLYYLTDEGRIIWCTELSPIVLHSGRSFNLDDQYFAGFLVGYPEVGLTPYREIRAVPPGGFARFCKGRTSVERYWTLDPGRKTYYQADTDYEEHFRQVFRQAVRRRLRSNAPILADLSGGLDSSSILCMADDIIASGEAHPPCLDTLSLYCPGEAGDPSDSDEPYFRAVERKRGRTGIHRRVEDFGGTAFLRYNSFEAVPGSLGDSSGAETDLNSSEAQPTYRVRLSGTGGDEVLGGIPDPRSQLADLLVRLQPFKLMRQLMAWSSAKRIPWIQLLVQSLIHISPVALRAALSKDARIPTWIDDHFANRYKLAKLRLGSSESFGFWLPSRREYAQTVHTLIRHMSHRLLVLGEPAEIRYPFLDQDLVEFLMSIPASQLLRPGERRSLMRRALVNILPTEVVQRRGKAVGSRFPILSLANHKETLEQIFSSPLCSQLHYINRDRFLECIRAAANGKDIKIWPTLRTVAMELWLRDMAMRGLIRLPTVPQRSMKAEFVQTGAS